MNLECSQVMLNTSDVKRAREFYIDLLGFPVIEEYPTMFAFRAGSVRFTVVGGGTALPAEPEDNPPSTVMFRTTDIEATVSELRSKGVNLLGDIEDAPGFMRHVALLDPDNNVLYIAQYLRDPLK